jgi:hypothetical protein
MSFIKSKWQGSKFEEKIKDVAVAENLNITSTPIGLSLKIMEIGVWDMDTVTSVNVTHGIGDISKIRDVVAVIRQDDGSFVYRSGNPRTHNDMQMQFGIGGINTSTLEIYRLTGGVIFDQSNFDSTSYNRGWITILYEA